MSKRSLTRLGVALLSMAVLAPSMAPAQAAGEIKIGVITSTSGPLSTYGVAFNEGLEWGLKYYTGGKMAINGQKLVVTSKDDGADPASARECTATYSMPSRWQVRAMRQAISPRLAMRILLNMDYILNTPKRVGSFGPAAASARPSVSQSRVSAGSITLSTHKRDAAFRAVLSVP